MSMSPCESPSSILSQLLIMSSALSMIEVGDSGNLSEGGCVRGGAKRELF